MKSQRIVEFISLSVGFVVSFAVFFYIFEPKVTKSDSVNVKNLVIKSSTKNLNSSVVNSINKLYNTSIADKLFEEVRILCLVLTYPPNHKTKAIHVKNTWGKRCNKLIFLSTEDDAELGAVELPIEEKYDYLWGKIKFGFQLAYFEHFDNFDWFVKADDDSYFIIENLRNMLYQYHSETAIIIGHKLKNEKVKDGYLSGGGYILSKKALEKFVHRVLDKNCDPEFKGAEDLLVAKCLQEEVLFIDGHDENHEKQFFPLNIEENFKDNASTIDSWYFDSQWMRYNHGNLSCCSEELVALHYIKPPQMYLIDHLLYHVYPFGFKGNHKTEIFRKLTFDEILNAANEKSQSVNSTDQENEHHFDYDEMF